MRTFSFLISRRRDANEDGGEIDTPYLTEGSSGLTYAVDRFKGWSHGGHLMLARGERSRLADYASEVL